MKMSCPRHHIKWILWFVPAIGVALLPSISMSGKTTDGDRPSTTQSLDSKILQVFTPATRTLSATTEVLAATAPAPTTMVVAQTKPTTLPSTLPDVATSQPVRSAIPTKEQQAKSRALMVVAFANAMKDHSPNGKRNLVVTLFHALPAMEHNPSDQYVLLLKTITAAKDAADLRRVILAADLLAYYFDVDANPIKAQAAVDMPLQSDLPEISQANLNAGLKLLRQLIQTRDMTAAYRLATALHAPAVDHPAVLATLQSHLAEIGQFRVAHTRMTSGQAALKKNPKDPSACTAVGSFDCFFQDDWLAGLPLLAEGADAALKKSAMTELNPKASLDDLMEAADQWWTFSEKQPEPVRLKIQRHAGRVYERGLLAASGLRRAEVERRIADARQIETPGLPTSNMTLAFFKASGLATPDRASTEVPAPFNGKTDPLLGDNDWSDNPSGYSLSGNVQIGNGDRNHGGNWVAGTVHAQPGFYLEGGTITVSAGALELNGVRDHPIILKNVQIVCEYTAGVKATNTIFDHCTFIKGGNWYWNEGYSSKWEMQDCFFHASNFSALRRFDYGIKLHRCTAVDCSFANRQWENDDVGDDLNGNPWNDISDCDFYQSQIEVSSAWLMQRCNLFYCTVGAADKFQSKTSLALKFGVEPEDLDVINALRSMTTSTGAGTVTYLATTALFLRQ